jgi:hypothetical protein
MRSLATRAEVGGDQGGDRHAGEDDLDCNGRRSHLLCFDCFCCNSKL